MMIDNQINTKINTIAKIILSYDYNPYDFGILGGNSGIMLFLLYYSKFSESEEAYNHSLTILEKTILSLHSHQSFNYTFGNGITGLLWTINHIVLKDFVDIEQSQFMVFDSYLSQAMVKQSKKGNYDFLHGALGISLYFSRLIKNSNLQNILFKLIENLDNTKTLYKKRGIAWEYFLRSKNKQVHNLSISHGLAGIVLVLVKFINTGVIRSNLNKELIIQSIGYLLSTKRKLNKNSLYPNYIFLSEDNIPKKNYKASRLAWCYGDLGISVALWHASQAMGRKDWEEEAKTTILHSAKRRNLQQNGVVDAGLCHGTAGIAHIFNRMYGYTGLKECKEASDYWFEQTLKMAKFEDGLAGYKSWQGEKHGWVNEPGLLEGIAGIGLAMISSVSDIEPAWDECLLLS